MKATTFEARREWPESAWSTDMAFPPEVVVSGEWRGEVETSGPWGMVSKYRALAVMDTELDTEHYGHYPKTAKVFGVRSLLNARESGYQMEGQVSVNGRKYRAFTSSRLFLVNGKLVDVAILYVCGKE